jgi:hypothetical protein
MVQGCLFKKQTKDRKGRVLPFRDLTGIDHLLYSRRVRRFMVDFSSEGSFGRAAKQMLEHHNLEIDSSTIYRAAMSIATKAEDFLESEDVLPYPEQGKPSRALLLEMDGVMVPIVTYTTEENGETAKELHWMELKVGAVQDPDRTKVHYACSFQDTDALGDQLFRLVARIRHLPHVHGIGDGAKWIPEQGERAAGSEYSHLIDYYHLLEYIHAAFEDEERGPLLVARCKEELKSGDLPKVVRRLKRQLKKNPGHEGVIDCIRYIKNRPGQFDYAGAIKKDLPIGSGLIESTNRSLIQERIKLPGAWWTKKNVRKMAALRVVRANGHWEDLWLEAA